jgi:hypothetical protein
MNDKVVGPVGEVPVVRIHQSFPLGAPGANMIFETYVPQDIEVKQVNKIVDKMEAVATRQMMKGELQDHNMTRDIQNIEEHYQRKQQKDLADGRRNVVPMSPKEQQDKRTVQQSLEVNRDTIKRLRKEIDDLLQVIDGEEKLAAE